VQWPEHHKSFVKRSHKGLSALRSAEAAPVHVGAATAISALCPEHATIISLAFNVGGYLAATSLIFASVMIWPAQSSVWSLSWYASCIAINMRMHRCVMLLQAAQMPHLVGTMALSELERWLDAAAQPAYDAACRSIRDRNKPGGATVQAEQTRPQAAPSPQKVSQPQQPGASAEKFAQYLTNFYAQVRCAMSV
jgi:hypothetical protein